MCKTWLYLITPMGPASKIITDILMYLDEEVAVHSMYSKSDYCATVLKSTYSFCILKYLLNAYNKIMVGMLLHLMI